jgi:predicted Zn-dependent protease
MHGQLESAVRQLEIALNQPDLDYYRNARLAARLQEYRGELAELKKSQR